MLWHHCKLWFSRATHWHWKLTFLNFVSLTGFWMRTTSAGWCHHSLDWHFLVERSHFTCLNEKWLGPFTSPPKGKVSHIKPWWGYVGMRTKHCVHYISLLDITKSLYLRQSFRYICVFFQRLRKEWLSLKNVYLSLQKKKERNNEKKRHFLPPPKKNLIPNEIKFVITLLKLKSIYLSINSDFFKGML